MKANGPDVQKLSKVIEEENTNLVALPMSTHSKEVDGGSGDQDIDQNPNKVVLDFNSKSYQSKSY